MAKNQANRAPTAAEEKSDTASIELRRILVPLDFSECSRKALKYAFALTSLFKSEITVIHVVPNVRAESRLAYDMPELQQSLLRDADQKLEQEVNALGAQGTGIKTLVKKGVPFNEIVQVAQKTNTDLIVIGTHGRTGFTHVLLGSTAERVMRHAPCPVLVVREQEREFVKKAL